MTCPSCGLENPPSAQCCDCGYDFVQGRVASSGLALLPNSQQNPLLAPALSVGLALVGCLLGQFGWPGWNYSGAILILSPGIYVSRWFMPTHFATPNVRLAILASISALVYWPVFFFLLEFVRDRKQMLQFLTPKRLLSALGIGAAASLIAYKLNILAPTVFGLLTVPSAYASFPFTVLFGPGKAVRWSVPLGFVGGCLAYSVIAFFVLYRRIWRKIR